MFQYYAVRGNMELIRDDGAVKCCLGEGGAVVESEVVVEVLPTYSEPRRGGSTQSKQGGPNFRLLGTHGSVVQPERDLVAPPRVTASAPLFPRLRPTHEEDKHSVFHQLSEEAEQREARQKRRSNVNLPSVQTYYGGMYWQPSPITDGLKVSLEEQARQHAKAAAQALEERIITPASTGNAAAPVATSMKRLSLSTSQTRRPSAQSRISPKSSLGVRPPLPESPQLDISHTESMMLSTAKLPQSDTTVTALGKHEGHIAAAQEMEDIFVAAHFIQHPELAEKREQSERLRRASQAASAPKKRKKKKARRGPKPPPEGAPAENLRFFRTSLLTCCDAQGQISRSQLERVLADLPFEVTNMVAVHEFFDDIRVMTEAKQDEAQPIADAASNSMGTNPQDPDTSRRSVGNLPSGTMGTVSNQTSTSKLFSASSRPRLAMGSSVRSLEKHTNSSQQQLPLAPLDAASPVKGIVAQLEDPVVYLREILAALDAIINGPDTRMVIRWVCFQTLAAEGKGYIHKATVQLIRKQLREECEKPDCPLSASSIKVLSDCFDRIAQEEEEEYIKVLNKGKRKKKAPVLQSHQKSAIPLNVMRKCHMDFKTFCRLFDLLPQVPAAFTRVWMGLLFTGHVGPTPATPPSARNAVVIQSPVESPLGLNRSRSETSTGAPAHNNGLSSYSPTSPANTHTGFTIGGSQHASTAAHDDPSIMADEGSRASKRTMMLDYEEMGDEEFHMAEVEPNTYPLLKLGRLGPRQEILRRLIHARLEVMRQGKDAILRQQQQEEEQRRQEELEREEMNAKRE